MFVLIWGKIYIIVDENPNFHSKFFDSNSVSRLSSWKSDFNSQKCNHCNQSSLQHSKERSLNTKNFFNNEETKYLDEIGRWNKCFNQVLNKLGGGKTKLSNWDGIRKKINLKHTRSISNKILKRVKSTKRSLKIPSRNNQGLDHYKSSQLKRYVPLKVNTNRSRAIQASIKTSSTNEVNCWKPNLNHEIKEHKRKQPKQKDSRMSSKESILNNKNISDGKINFVFISGSAKDRKIFKPKLKQGFRKLNSNKRMFKALDCSGGK